MSKNKEKTPVEKKEPGIVTLTVTLFGICAVCALLLGLTNMITAPIIKDNAEAKKTAAIAAEVLPGFTGTLTQVNYIGSDRTINSILKGSDGSYVVEVSPKNSFSGTLTLLVGVDENETVTGVSVTASGESPGLGARASEPEFRNQFAGKSGTVSITKDGGEIQAISGASITSRAVCDAVNSALDAIHYASDGPFDPSLVPSTPDEPNVSENIISMAKNGDGYVAVVDCGPDSFSKTLTIEVRIGADKAVTGVTVLKTEETPGLGARASEPEFIDQFIGVNSEVSWTTGENPDGDIQSISGASTTSGAICSGVNAALKAIDYPDQWPAGTVEPEEPEKVEGPSVVRDGDDYVVLVDCGEDSFSKTLTIEVRIDADKTVKSVTIVETNETPGLGALASEPAFIDQFIGVSADVSLTKDGGTIESIAGASTTSGAICKGVNAALQAVNSQG